MIDQTARTAGQRPAWLAASVLVHAAVFIGWRNAPASRPEPAAQRESALVLLHLAPPPVRVAPARRQFSPVRQRRPAGIAAAVPATASASASPPAQADAGPPPPTMSVFDPFARPAVPAPQPGTLATARLAAGGIDRQLRKESLNKFATIVDEEKADRYSINGAAYRPAPAPESFADGRGIIHKRHLVRGKMVCETVDHVSAEAFRKGSIGHIVKCPK